MKATKENINILKKLGFSSDVDKHGKTMEDWWSLDCGWGFRIDKIKDFKMLVKRLMSADFEQYVENNF